ncbi:hypothetical protein AAV94_11480 [Lampropedia cohaerens]|uniref:Putative NAD(P)H nitroreductase n=1 Tax=Lampropedia cohaerens TaxID=1610491 RepID=A0A0U1PYC8_9BURK|nr:nitroreductase family protein [Lampropedia cohaerens]KKW67471.1 hypothetical protein AAV94_11480 [Lampropedia cohaerens]
MSESVLEAVTSSAHVVRALLARRSAWPLGAPAPDDAALRQILQAAACAPDHGQLTPWRAQYVRDDARHALLQRVLAHPLAQSQEALALHGKYTAKLTTAPLVLVLAARVQEHPKVPEFEQLLSCGAAAMNMLNAACLLGFHGFWSSTPGLLGQLLKEVMGFAPTDHMLGLLNLGTAVQKQAVPAQRPAPEVFAKQWQP